MADIEENTRRKAAGKKEIPLSPIAIEVVRRIDALFEIERAVNGKSAAERLAVRQKLSQPLVEHLQVYLREQRARFSRGHDLAKAINYILKRWPAFTLFLEGGRVCLSNNAAERGLRGIALGRKSWPFCGSDRGGRARGGHVPPDRHLQDEWRRSASLVGRRPRPHRRPPCAPTG
ncbi:hypothetical protein GGD83_003818 [Rhodoblastus sphagnicola]|nr:hypothetical protein [Rhodoblastus sphagnicola]